MAAYDPLSYHSGSVWPHDTALCIAGAARHGCWEAVDRPSGRPFASSPSKLTCLLGVNPWRSS